MSFARRTSSAFVTALAVSALVCVASVGYLSSGRLGSGIVRSAVTSRVSHRIGSVRRGLRACADLEGMSFANVDYRKFGSAYDGYRSILKDTRGLYGDELKTYLDDGYLILDVRPHYEVERIKPVGSTHIPLITEVKDGGLSSFARKWTNTIYAGHSRDLTRNDNFVEDVKAQYPADAKLIVSCAEGLRSLLATKALRDAGYAQAFWLAGGLSGVPKGVLTDEGTSVDVGYRRAGLDGGKLASDIFDGVTSFRWWELGKEKKE
mmetsp:Transcript_16115/g.32655  ORF Transcript_16115/g.32655 Transcript_16115/m.32655 type:complete len:263 (-) Transcript_16115:382-1170(-)